MVERSDRAPLLDWEEVPSAEKPQPGGEERDRDSSPSNSNRAQGSTAPGIGWSTGPGGPGSTSVSPDPDTTTALAERDAQCGDEDDHSTDTGQEEVPHDNGMGRWEEKDQIVSVFVVGFNTRSGE